MNFALPEMNYLAVLISAVSMMIIGAIWYGPLFGKLWMQGMGIDPSDAAKKQEMQKASGPAYFQMFIGALLTSFVFSYFFGTWWNGNNLDQAISGMFYGSLAWLGFALPIIYSKTLWEGKKFKYVAIDLGYYLISLLAIGVITALMVNIPGFSNDSDGYIYSNEDNQFTISLNKNWKDYQVFKIGSAGETIYMFCVKTTDANYPVVQGVNAGFACPFSISKISPEAWQSYELRTKELFIQTTLGIKNGYRYVYQHSQDLPGDFKNIDFGENNSFDSFHTNLN